MRCIPRQRTLRSKPSMVALSRRQSPRTTRSAEQRPEFRPTPCLKNCSNIRFRTSGRDQSMSPGRKPPAACITTISPRIRARRSVPCRYYAPRSHRFQEARAAQAKAASQTDAMNTNDHHEHCPPSACVLEERHPLDRSNGNGAPMLAAYPASDHCTGCPSS